MDQQDGRTKRRRIPGPTMVVVLAGLLVAILGAVWTTTRSSDRPSPVAGTPSSSDAPSTAAGAGPLLLVGHPGTNVPERGGAVWAPDGSALALKQGPLVEIRDPSSGRLLRRLSASGSDLWPMSYSADSSRLVTIDANPQRPRLQLWDMRTGAPAGTLQEKGDQPYSAAAYAPDGRTVAAATGTSVRIWDAGTGRLTATLTGFAGAVGAVAFGPDGSALTIIDVPGEDSGDPGENITVRQVPSGTVLRRSRVDDTSGNCCVYLSSDGSLFASPLAPVDLRSGKTLCASAKLDIYAVSRDRRVAVTVSQGHPAEIWDLTTCTRARTLAGPKADTGQYFVLSDDGRRVAATRDHGLRLWDVTTGAELPPVERYGDEVTALAYSPRGGILASGGADGVVQLWNTATATPVTTLTGPLLGIRSLAFSPDGGTLVACAEPSDPAELWSWDVASGKPLWHAPDTGTARCGPVQPGTFSPDGKTLARGDGSEVLQFRDAATGAVRALPSPGPKAAWAVYSPDGRSLAVATTPTGASTGTGTPAAVLIVDAATGAVRHRLPVGAGAPTSAVFRADGAALVVAVHHTGGPPTSWQLWDLAHGTLIRTIAGDAAAAAGSADSPSLNAPIDASAAISPDGTLLATGGPGDVVELRSVADGHVLRRFTDAAGPVTGVAFAPDGKALAASSLDGAVRQWPL